MTRQERNNTLIKLIERLGKDFLQKLGNTLDGEKEPYIKGQEHVIAYLAGNKVLDYFIPLAESTANGFAGTIFLNAKGSEKFAYIFVNREKVELGYVQAVLLKILCEFYDRELREVKTKDRVQQEKKDNEIIISSPAALAAFRRNRWIKKGYR